MGKVFSKDTLSSLPKGDMVVDHMGYGTTGGTARSSTQPVEVNRQGGEMVVAHNGNLSNSSELRDRLELPGAIFNATSNTEAIAYVITREKLKISSIEEAVSKAMNSLEDAYSLVLMSFTKLIVARDPYGLRPLCYGKTIDGRHVIALESCILSTVGAVFIRDVLSGEIAVFSKENVISQKGYCNKEERRACIFEYIYFARPDSIIDTISVSLSRCKTDELLAESYPVNADIVIEVPDSNMEAALSYANAFKILYGIGLIKNECISEALISPGQDERLDQVRIKLSPVRNVIEGKRVVLIGDPIIRDATSKRIVKLLKDVGAKEIHTRIPAPPFLYPCYYGTDIDSEENLIACHHSVWEIEEILGVDSLEYLLIEKLGGLIEGTEYCAAYFNGKYPISILKDLRGDRFEGKLSERTCSEQERGQFVFVTRTADIDTAQRMVQGITTYTIMGNKSIHQNGNYNHGACLSGQCRCRYYRRRSYTQKVLQLFLQRKDRNRLLSDTAIYE